MSSLLVEVALANINFQDPSEKKYDPVINEVLDYVSKKANIPKEELTDKFWLSYNNLRQNPGVAFPLRSALFNILDLVDDIDLNIKLEEISKLYDQIRAYFKMFRKIKDIFTGKMFRPLVIFVPNPLLKNPLYDSVTTGAASPKGEIIFNIKFVKKLIYIAELELKYGIIKIKSKVFQSNGGVIPDRLVYVAFLIIHELFHLIHSDVEYLDSYLVKYLCKNKKKYKRLKNIPDSNCEKNPVILNIANQVQNIVADYFNNYNICRLGLPALPVGLFSNEINLEKMNYIQAYDKILKQMDEMSEDQINQMMAQQDNHVDANDNVRNNPQQSQGQSQKQQNQQQGQGEQKQGNQNQQQEQGQGQQGNQQNGNQEQEQQGNNQQNQQGQTNTQQGQREQGEGQPSTGVLDMPQEDVSKQLDGKKEEIEKEIEETAKDTITKKISKDELEKEIEKIRSEESQKIDKKRLEEIAQKLKNSEKGTQIDFANIKPKYNWKQIILKMKPSGEDSVETYAKPSRKSSSRLLQIKQTGSAAIKPGLKKEPTDGRSVLFVIDRSGSMSYVFGKINTEMKQLITKKMSKYFDNFYVIKFDNKFAFYRIDIEENKLIYYPQMISQISKMKKWDVNIFKKMKGTNKELKTMFDTSDWAGGTDLSEPLVKLMKMFLDIKTNNAILITDTDILWKENKKRLNSLIVRYGKTPFKFNIILDTRSSFIQFIKEFRGFRYLTYFEE